MPVRIAVLLAFATVTVAAQSVTIREQGARPFGGTVVGDPAKGSLHCDHGYLEWQIPETPRRVPLVMVHASSTKTWDTTFDGREGFRHIFLRRGFPVYLTDLPRTGRAGQGCGPTSYTPELNHDQVWFTNWRLGLWLPGDPTPDFYPGVQFPQTERALNEFFRIQYPEFNAPENERVETDALAALLNEIGPSVLLTHSSTGIRGWITATKTTNVAAIVSYEPGDAVFPESEMPPPIERIDGMKLPPGRAIPMADFLKLTKVPIQIVWGDYIPSTPDTINVGPRLSLDNRRVNVMRATLMVDAIRRHGGDAVNILLPEIGIRGNTHFPMLDLNNVQIADLLSKFLAEKRLDRR
ncbi:MAG: alpha/beta fold hydrolase [Acidobacteria bacterium]|nr:alpha/beta fold hydrolase [Acidobacteriota bacterium]